MTEHLTPEEIAAYHSRTLPIRALFRVSDHASSCAQCGVQIRRSGRARLEATLARARLELSSTHLSYDEMEGYVGSRLEEDDLVRVKDHLDACRMCSKDLDAMVKPAAHPDVLTRPVGHRGRQWLWAGGVGGGALACAAALLVILFALPRHRREALPPGVDRSTIRGGIATPSASAIHDGDRLIRLSGGSLAGLEGLPETYRDAIVTALTSGRLEGVPQNAPRLSGGRGVLMGDSETAERGAHLIKPVAEVVGVQNPVLEWTPGSGAIYDVSVGDSEFNEVVHSGWIHENSWRVPVALERGKTYSWQVVFRRNGKDVAVPSPSQPAARFEILSAVESAELDGLRQHFGSSHLVMGTALARLGMWDDATAHFAALRRENPDSHVVMQLLEDVGKLRRDAH